MYKFIRNLGPASRAVLLSGPTEIYLQMLAKALAHYFEAELLLLDVLDFSVDIQNKYGYSKKERGPVIRSSISGATLEKLYSMFGSLSSQPPKDDNQGKLCRQTSSTDLNSCTINRPRKGSASLDMSTWASQLIPPIAASNKCGAFDEKLFLQALYKVLVSVSNRSPVILYIRDVEGLFLQSDRLHNLFTELLKKLTGSIFVLGSRILDPYCDFSDVNEKITLLFPYNIEIRPPKDENQLRKWDTQLEEDMKVIQFQDNKNHITEVLSANDLLCDDLGSICYADKLLLGKHMEEIVVSAVYYHLMNHKEAEYRCGKLVLSSASLSHGLHIFQEGKVGRDKASHEINAEGRKDTGKSITSAAKLEPKSDATANKCDAKKDNGITPPAQKADNEFEKRIRAEVIPADEIGVNFQDIGALDEVKESLQELVLLPLRRPDLFKGGLLKPCRGILLFGPPGTGKTMLAKAIASEAGASFINVSISTITSRWFGEDEKNVRALFTLAAKVSPTIIFVDEVDSMLGQRTTNGEHEAMRKIKNEFMTRWDGLITKPAEQVLVLAATNRPFDLDDAIIRRFERRVMVGLPSAENREMILRTLVSKDKTDELDFKQLATITEGYSGSDLKNLCIAAAYRPVRELIQQEREKSVETGSEVSDSQNSLVSERKGEEVITPRALNMEDMKWAKSQVGASFAMEGAAMEELRQWNLLYGEGGSRKKEYLTYFL